MIYLSKSLAAANSTNLGTISTAATPVVTLSGITLDTARRIQIISTSSGDTSGTTFRITGTRQGGGTLVETISGTTNSTIPFSTTQDFLTVTAVTVTAGSSPVPTPLTIGTNSVGGTLWQSVNYAHSPVNIGVGITYSTTVTPLLGRIEFAFEDPTNTIMAPLTSVGTPIPFISTAFSTAANTNTAGYINLPISCWRLTITSTSSSATPPTVYATAVSAGVGG